MGLYTHLDMQALKVRDFTREVALVINGTGWHLVGAQNAMSDSDAVIVFTKSRCLMNYTCTIGIGHVSVYQNSESFIFKLKG